jgi:peptidoglycan/LPS O-acetylase OafA/YrhL
MASAQNLLFIMRNVLNLSNQPKCPGCAIFIPARRISSVAHSFSCSWCGTKLEIPDEYRRVMSLIAFGVFAVITCFVYQRVSSLAFLFLLLPSHLFSFLLVAFFLKRVVPPSIKRQGSNSIITLDIGKRNQE